MAIEYSKMKVAELKDALKAKGLPSVGSKAEMAERLEKHQKEMVDAEDDILDATNTDEEGVKKEEEEIEKETEASPETTEVIKKAETVEHKTKVAEKKKPTEMTNEERLRMRAERFGLSQPPAGGQEVGRLVKRRQQRFGEEPKARKLAPEVVAEPKEMDEKMKARLERFKMK